MLDNLNNPTQRGKKHFPRKKLTERGGGIIAKIDTCATVRYNHKVTLCIRITHNQVSQTKRFACSVAFVKNDNTTSINAWSR